MPGAIAGCAGAAIAPVQHRLPERIRAHAMICFLALVRHRVMRERLRRTGSALSVKHALATLKRIQKHRIQINHNTVTGTSRITPEQHDLFKAMALTAPAEINAL